MLLWALHCCSRCDLAPCTFCEPLNATFTVKQQNTSSALLRSRQGQVFSGELTFLTFCISPHSLSLSLSFWLVLLSLLLLAPKPTIGVQSLIMQKASPPVCPPSVDSLQISIRRSSTLQISILHPSPFFRYYSFLWLHISCSLFSYFSHSVIIQLISLVIFRKRLVCTVS